MNTQTATFDVIYDEYFDFVWKSLRRLGVSVTHIDDATQDVFLVVLRKLDGFEGRSSLKTWLFGIAHLVSLGYRRKSRRDPEFSDVEAALSEWTTPQDRALLNERVAFLEAFLDTLDDLKRPVFILAELEQMSGPEIAEALEIKLNTVYSRLRSARLEFNDAVNQSQHRKETA